MQPILDNHLHLDPERGRGLEAVAEFSRAGGTHLFIVNQPSWKLGEAPVTPDDFTAVFEHTIALAEEATDILEGRAWPVLGVHPALISRLCSNGFGIDGATQLMQEGLTIAAEYTRDGPAIALKSGRPHYDVSSDIWEASNAVLRHALMLGAETSTAVQLHTESTNDLTEIAKWADAVDLPPENVVKHYAAGKCAGVTPSVISRRDALEAIVDEGTPFLMETDFLDDPARPGAVLGPKTVPRRVTWLRDNGHAEAVHLAHVETPHRVYGVDLTQ